MNGRRTYPDFDGDWLDTFAEGDYCQDPQGKWLVRPPRSGFGYITFLGPRENGWQVTEHEDHTITATPSIKTATWHGFLERGVWREVP